MEHHFISLCVNLYDFFGEVSVIILVHFLIGLFFFLIVRVLSILCVFGVTIFHYMYLFKYFLPVWFSCLFILLTLSFMKLKLSILMKSSSSMIYFVDCALGVIFKKSLPFSRSSRFSPCYLPEVLQFCILLSVDF